MSAPGPVATRREFLAAGVAAAAIPALAMAQPPAGGGGAAPPAAAPPGAPGAEGAEGARGGITPATIAAAETLVGIEFSESERALMARSLGQQVARIKRRQGASPLENGLAPALTFDPRLPGMEFEREQRALVRSAAPSPLPEVPAGDEDLAYAPVRLLSRWIEARKLTSARLTGVYLERLRRLDSKLKFVVTLTEDLAREQAAGADAQIAAGKYRGPLHGIPWGAKDLLDTAGIATTWGAEPYAERVPETDAAVVRRLAEAGAVLVAKTTLGALAMGDVWHGGRTNNPWDVTRGSSGSSAGSAAAVASGCVGFAIGTETLGSIISPSRACGSTGLRPTFGRVARTGAMALCWSMDKIGPMARCAEDCALVLAAINGADRGDPGSLDMPLNFDAGRPVKGLRVGYRAGAFEGRGLAPEHGQVRQALEGVGCELVEFSLPQWPFDCLMNILHCEAAAAFEELTRSGKDDELKEQGRGAWPNSFRQSWFVPGVELIQAHRVRRRCMEMMREKFEGLDAIVDPSNTGPLCLITNSTGHPSLTLRIGFGDGGMPVATTLIGRLFDEGTIVNLGSALEGELGVWERRPGV
ncbi:MAG: amidase [Phycisphaerales bacterium]